MVQSTSGNTSSSIGRRGNGLRPRDYLYFAGGVIVIVTALSSQMNVAGFVNQRASTVESVSSSVAAKPTEMDQPQEPQEEQQEQPSRLSRKQPKPIPVIEFDDEKDETTSTDLISTLSRTLDAAVDNPNDVTDAGGAEMTKDPSAGTSATSATTTSTLSSSTTGTTSTKQEIESLLGDKDSRMQRYRERYNYQPPLSPTGETDKVANSTTTTTGTIITGLCASGHPYTEFFAQDRNQHSANAEDRTIYQKFFASDKTKRGLYLEMGAFDGITESNTRFFDECLNWDGVLVEANPKMYPKLLENRPRAHRLSFAPSCNTIQEAANNTIAFHVSTFTSAAQSDIVEENRNFGSVQVPCGPLTPVLLDLLQPSSDGKIVIDFFSLDVEGAEPLILQHLDLNEILVKVMIVESSNNHCKEHCPARDQVRQLLDSYGYERKEGVVTRSDLYIHPSVQQTATTTTE